MKKTLNIVPENPYIVFIALNPTKEAIQNNAVFSRDNSFWNLLIKAKIIKESVLEVELISRANDVFQQQKHSDFKLGFADLLPLITETDSKKVQIPDDAVCKLLKNTPHLKDTKRIALLGQKVVDSFARAHKGLIKWQNIPIIEGKRQFGKIGKIYIEEKEIELFAMPFPVNNNIENKHKYYNSLIK